MASRSQKRVATDQRILEAWAQVEEETPDKSTPWVASMVAERCGVEYGRVFDALLREAERNGTVVTP